tara:strand:- start:60 stop:554 length:495 start_codon:yes stop_codon:yes gene_type:complete
MNQKIKTFYLYSIKRLFKRILIFTILISIPNNFVVADENNLEDYFCDVSNARLLEKDVISLSFKDKNFNQVISKIEKKPNDGEYNLLVTAGQKPSSGYSLEFIKIKKKKKFDKIYFKETRPKKNSINLAVITYPFCLVKIENLDNYKVKIKKKRSKLFPFSIFN